MTRKHIPGSPRLWKGYEPEVKVVRFDAQGNRQPVSRWQVWTGGALAIFAVMVLFWSLLDALYKAAVGQ